MTLEVDGATGQGMATATRERGKVRISPRISRSGPALLMSRFLEFWPPECDRVNYCLKPPSLQ